MKIDNREIKHVITDIDGVVVDRMPIYGEAFSEILNTKFGIEKSSALEMYFSSVGMPISQQFVMVLAENSYEVSDELVSELVEKFFEKSERHTPVLFPHAKNVLHKVRVMGLSLCATSGSKTQELLSIFEDHGLVYDYVLGSDQIPKSSEHIKLFAEHFGLTLKKYCEGTLYLGDGPRDMEIAKENGILAIGIATTVSKEKLIEAGADIVIDEIEELLAIIERGTVTNR